VRVIVSRARSTQASVGHIENTLNKPEQRERDIEKRTLRAQSRARRVSSDVLRCRTSSERLAVE